MLVWTNQQQWDVCKGRLPTSWRRGKMKMANCTVLRVSKARREVVSSGWFEDALSDLAIGWVCRRLVRGKEAGGDE